MKRFIQRAAALIVCFAMLAAYPLSSSAVTVGVTPIIYIADSEEIDLYTNPNTTNQKLLFDVNSDEFRSACLKMLTAILLTSDQGAASAVPDVTAAIDGILSPIACNDAGRSRNPSVGPLQYDKPLSKYPDDEPVNTATLKAIADAVAPQVSRNYFYVFQYDWRLDPIENAASLRAFIGKVLSDSGAGSVSLLAGGYGGVVANAYLYRYREEAAQKIFSCVFLNSPLMGNALIGDLMKGKIVKKAEDNDGLVDNYKTISGEERGEALLKYLKDDPNNFIASLTQSMLGDSLIGQFLGAVIKGGTLDLIRNEGSAAKLAKLYNNFVLLSGDSIYGAGLREYLRTMPGLWALVPTKDYNAAMQFLYGDEILDYDFSQRLADARAVTDNTANTLKHARADGIRTYVVANYGRQILPGTISIDDLSDGIESTKYASAGATTAECGKEWTVQLNCIGVAHNHRSPDEDIDSSTCALPENTWFIKDLKHMDFQYKTTAEFVAYLITSATQLSVWDSTDYPQYLIYSKSRKYIAPYSSSSGTGVERYLRGDVDLDGVITSSDARLVLRYAVGLEQAPQVMWIIADVDQSGEVQPADARLVLRFSVGLITAFPPAAENTGEE